MSIHDHNFKQKNFSINNENSNNFEYSGIKIIEAQITKRTNENKSHDKKKIKNKFLKKENNIDTISDKKIIKVKDLIDDEYINNYNPIIQNNNINPKLQFFIDYESVSESDKDLSSASISIDSINNEEKNEK